MNKMIYFVYLGSIIHSNGDCSQEIRRRLRLRRAAVKELEKIIQCNDVSLETKIKIIHTLVFPITMYGWESWTVKKASRGFIWNTVLDESFADTLDCQKDKQGGLDQIKPKLSLEAKTLKLRLSYFGHIMRRQDSLEKTIILVEAEGSRKRGSPNARWTVSLNKVTGFSLQELSKAVEDRTFGYHSLIGSP